jgi:hypothetical protein
VENEVCSCVRACRWKMKMCVCVCRWKMKLCVCVCVCVQVENEVCTRAMKAYGG